jgi:phosphotransferase system  glucose/maltose/N-acetylglucosamine-specific IIC component
VFVSVVAQLALLFAFVGSLLCFGIVWALAGYREPLWGWHTWIGLGNGFVLFFIAEVLSILFGIAVEKENLAQQVRDNDEQRFPRLAQALPMLLNLGRTHFTSAAL